MIVGIIQPNYLPWRGYFDIIDDVDIFIFYDDIQYTKNDWRNRNKIKTSNGTGWITVPVNHKHLSQLICNTSIDYSQNWINKHTNLFNQWYKKAQYFDMYIDEILKILMMKHPTISELNITLSRWIIKQLNIKTKLYLSSEFNVHGSKTDRLIRLLKKVNATSYLSGPAAKQYIDENLFRDADIGLLYKLYEYTNYPQLHGTFEPNVSTIDLLFNCGPESRNYLKSRQSNLA
jgi:hypothetical protein